MKFANRAATSALLVLTLLPNGCTRKAPEGSFSEAAIRDIVKGSRNCGFANLDARPMEAICGADSIHINMIPDTLKGVGITDIPSEMTIKFSGGDWKTDPRKIFALREELAKESDILPVRIFRGDTSQVIVSGEDKAILISTKAIDERSTEQLAGVVGGLLKGLTTPVPVTPSQPRGNVL